MFVLSRMARIPISITPLGETASVNSGWRWAGGVGRMGGGNGSKFPVRFRQKQRSHGSTGNDLEG